MTKSKRATHTPGPWEPVTTQGSEHSSTQLVTAVRDGETLVVALCDESLDIPREEREANARLIAALPDLLAALKKIDLCYDGDPYGCCGNEASGRATLKGSFIKALEDARAAIKKAKG